MLVQNMGIRFMHTTCFVISSKNVRTGFIPEQKLVEHLLQNYSKHARPVENPQTVVIVRLQLHLSELVELVRRLVSDTRTARVSSWNVFQPGGGHTPDRAATS